MCDVSKLPALNKYKIFVETFRFFLNLKVFIQDIFCSKILKLLNYL